MVCRSRGGVLACLALALITVTVNCDLRIHPYFQHNIKHVNVGDELVVYCRQYGASSSDGGSFQWIPSLEGDERVSSEEEDFLAGYQSILRINGVAREHHNTYTCTYRNENGQIDSASVSFDLIVLAPPRFLSCSERQNVTKDQNDMVICSVDVGEPPATVTWSRGGHPIADGRFEVITEQGLLISSVMEEDAGVYQCNLIRDGWGAEARNINIAVKDGPCPQAPEINTDLLPSSMAVGYNETLELTCSLQSGQATMLWSVPGIGLKPGPTLSVQAPPAAGVYLCIAQGNDGCPSDAASVSVTVNAPPLPPSKSETKLAEIGKTAILHCSIYSVPMAHPSPTYTWTKQGRSAPYPQGGGGRVMVDSSQKLHITGVEESDFGTYVCTVVNEFGVSLQIVQLASQHSLENDSIAVTVKTDQCDEQRTEAHITADIVEILEDWCLVGDCSVEVHGNLHCCNKTHGIYDATVVAISAQSLVKRFNETKLHETNLELVVCEEGCQCAEDKTKADSQTSEDGAATSGAIAGTLGFVLLVVAILAALAFWLIWQKKRKRRFSVASGDSSQGNADDVESQSTPQHAHAHQNVHLERAFADPAPYLTAGPPAIPPSEGGLTATSVAYSYPRIHCTVPHAPPHHHTLLTSPYHPSCNACTTSAHHACTCYSSPCPPHSSPYHSHTSLSCCHAHHPSPHSSPDPSIRTVTPSPPLHTGGYENGGVVATETAEHASRELPGYVRLPLASSRTIASP